MARSASYRKLTEMLSILQISHLRKPRCLMRLADHYGRARRRWSFPRFAFYPFRVYCFPYGAPMRDDKSAQLQEAKKMNWGKPG